MKFAKNSIMIYLYVFILLLLLICFMPIKVRIIRNDSKNDVDLFFIKIFNLRLDFDELIKYLLTTKNDRTKITIKSANHNLRCFKKAKNIIKTFCRFVEIKKFTIIIKFKQLSMEMETFLKSFAWLGISNIKSIVNNNFKRVENEYYSVQDDLEEKEMNFELIMNIRLIYLIVAVLINIKDIPKIYKTMKENKLGSTSYF